MAVSFALICTAGRVISVQSVELPPRDYPDGLCVREEGLETVYIRKGGSWWGFSSPLALFGAGKSWDEVETVARGAIPALRRVPPERTVFQDLATGHMFVVLGSTRFRVQSDDREALRVAMTGVVGVYSGTYEWIPYGGRYRRLLGAVTTARLARPLALLHRPIPQQIVWLVIGGIIGGALGPFGAWVASRLT